MSPLCDFEIFNRPHIKVDSCLDIEPYCSFRKLELPSMAIRGMNSCQDRYPPSEVLGKLKSIKADRKNLQHSKSIWLG